MISAATEVIPTDKETELRKWLRKGEVATLIAIAESRVKWYQAQALKDAVESSPTNSKMDSANAHLVTAQRYDTFVSVLMEFIQEPNSFTITKLT